MAFNDCVLKGLAFSDIKTARACYHRILFLEFLAQPDIASTQRFFTQRCHGAMQSALASNLLIKEVVGTLRARLRDLLSCSKPPITNAAFESAQQLHPSAQLRRLRFQILQNYRVHILFFLKLLNLQPI